jgi:hypothetical protein
MREEVKEEVKARTESMKEEMREEVKEEMKEEMREEMKEEITASTARFEEVMRRQGKAIEEMKEVLAGLAKPS